MGGKNGVFLFSEGCYSLSRGRAFGLLLFQKNEVTVAGLRRICTGLSPISAMPRQHGSTIGYSIVCRFNLVILD